MSRIAIDHGTASVDLHAVYDTHTDRGTFPVYAVDDLIAAVVEALKAIDSGHAHVYLTLLDPDSLR